MKRYDVVIVGGGPAGSAAGWRLVAAGLKVLVLDKKTFPRDKLCAGWITPPVLDELQIDAADYRSARILQPITGFLTGLISGNQVLTTYDEPASYGIRRCEFDDYLLQHSRAETLLGTPLQSFARSDGLWTINNEIQTPLLIGAGGHFCPVGRSLGSRVPSCSVILPNKPSA